MPRSLPISTAAALLAWSLAACAQAPSPAAAAEPAASPEPAAMSEPPATAAQALSAIEGSIREGNRPPPALRICAHPLDGGAPACVETEAGATAYRIEVAPGRYRVAGQALGDPGLKFAHAERIRCIRAPCPPDTAIVVEVGADAPATAIDLSAGDALPPGGNAASSD